MASHQKTTRWIFWNKEELMKYIQLYCQFIFLCSKAAHQSSLVSFHGILEFFFFADVNKIVLESTLFVDEKKNVHGKMHFTKILGRCILLNTCSMSIFILFWRENPIQWKHWNCELMLEVDSYKKKSNKKFSQNFV